MDIIFELYERAAKIYYKHFPTLVLIYLILELPLLILSEFVNPEPSPTQQLVGSHVMSIMLTSFIVGVLSSIANLAVIYLTAVAASNHKTGIKDTLISTFSKWWVAVVTSLMGLLLVSVGFIAFVIPGIALAVYLTFANQAVMLEKKRFVEALRHSINVVRGRWWYVFGMFLVLTLPALILGAISAQGAYNILNAQSSYHYFIPHTISTLVAYFGVILLTLFYLRLSKKTK